MGGGITGDFSALQQFTERVKSVPVDLARKISNAAAPVALDLARKSWSQRASPEGRSWSVRADGSVSTLRASGNLQSGLKTEGRPDGFALVDNAATAVGKRYAGTHQYGRTMRRGATKWRVPARPFLPRKRTLPRVWAIEIERVAVETFQKHLRG